MKKKSFVVATLLVAALSSREANAQGPAQASSSRESRESSAQSPVQSPADRETARTLMDDGDRYVEQQRFEEALKAYQDAHAIMHVPTTGIDVALTLTTLGRMVEAREVALEVTRMPVGPNESRLFSEARRDARELADRLAPKIPTLRLNLPSYVDAETVRASIDGEVLDPKALGVPRRLNPGKHAVRVEAPGRPVFVREIELKEAARSILDVDFRAAPSGDASDAGGKVLGLPVLAFAGLATSAVGLGVGTLTGLASLGKADDARARCGPDTKNCDPAAESDIQASKTLGWISTASFAIALAGGAVATYALVVTKGDQAKASASLSVSPAGAGAVLRGTF